MVSNKIGVAEENCWDGTDKKICAETQRLLYAGGVQKKAYFYSRGYYGGFGQISCMKTIGEFRPRWHGLRISTGVDFKIMGGQQKPLY